MIEHWIDGNFIYDEGCRVAGSPNRCSRRYAVRQIPDGAIYVLEGINTENVERRIFQAEQLERLAAEGNRQISPWLKSKDGSWGVFEDGLFWQCRQYVPGVELPRDSYALDGWRGKAAAKWLKSIHIPCQGAVFYITDYIHRLMHAIWHDSRALHGDLSDVLSALNLTHEEEAALPVVFSHGDFHPGNILWGEHCINAVIDWEFCGSKPICYDAANLLGCIGVDNPAWLEAPMAKAFLEELQLPEAAQKLLPRYIVAMRFAWMREWWHLHQKEMIIQELDFMWLMIGQL